MKVRESLPSLAVTLLGVALAWLGITVEPWIVPALVLLVVCVGYGADRHGKRLLPHAPEAAVRWMQWWVLVPGVLGAAGQALVIALGILVEVFKSASVEMRQLQTATLAALSTFVIVTFVRGAEEADEEWVGKRVREAFERADAQHWRFPAGSDGANAVYSNDWKDLHGWGREARRGRAREVAKALASQES
jgi:hypothetical protein